MLRGDLFIMKLALKKAMLNEEKDISKPHKVADS